MSALLRVPRASRSSLTCAKRSGNPLGGAVFSDAQAGSPRYMTHFAAMGVACPTQRSQGGARRAGDMSEVGYAAPMASPGTGRFENQAPNSSSTALNRHPNKERPCLPKS